MDPRSTCAIISRITARPGCRDELLSRFEAAVACTRDEPGTLVCRMLADRSDPDVIWFYDEYTDDDAMSSHRRNPAIAEATRGLRELFAVDPMTIALDIVARA